MFKVKTLHLPWAITRPIAVGSDRASIGTMWLLRLCSPWIWRLHWWKHTHIQVKNLKGATGHITCYYIQHTCWTCSSHSMFSGLRSCRHIPPLLKEMTDLIRLSATNNMICTSVFQTMIKTKFQHSKSHQSRKLVLKIEKNHSTEKWLDTRDAHVTVVQLVSEVDSS